MKSYKKTKICIGESDIATLVLAGPGKKGLKTKALHFGGDGTYFAYVCGPEQEIPEHYEKVWKCHSWLKIYDDNMLSGYVKNQEPADWTIYGNIEVYRAGDYGCLIRLCERNSSILD